MIENFKKSSKGVDDIINEPFDEPIPKDGGSPLIRRTDGLDGTKQKKPKITDFELQEVVGMGNFGKVHKAFNKKANRVCALKVLIKESVAQMKHVDHIINEREVLQYLTDRNRTYMAENPSQCYDEHTGKFIPECPFIMGIYSSF